MTLPRSNLLRSNLDYNKKERALIQSCSDASMNEVDAGRDRATPW